MIPPSELAFWLLGGAALGWAYFRVLRWSVERLLRPSAAAGWVEPVRLALRLGVAWCVFLGAAHWGGWSGLLAMLAGFLSARTVMLHRARAQPPAAGRQA